MSSVIELGAGFVKHLYRECAVENYLVESLKRKGIECIKFIPQHRVGMPDRLVLLPDGMVHWVEMKTEDGVLAPIQIIRHNQLRKSGHKVYVLKGKDDVDKYLSSLQTES